MVVTDVRTGQYVKYRSGDAEITAYLSQPTVPGRYPAMLVLQPVHGLIPLMEVIADRLAAREEGTRPSRPAQAEIGGGGIRRDE